MSNCHAKFNHPSFAGGRASANNSCVVRTPLPTSAPWLGLSGAEPKKQPMRRRFDYHGTRRALARRLLHNAEAHEAGSWNYLDQEFETIDRAVPREGHPEIESLLVALGFWKAWIAASRQGWAGPGPLGRADWPRVARRIVAALESDLEIDDPAILDEFGPRRPAP